MYKPNNAQGIPTPSNDPTYRTVCTLSGYHGRCIYSVSWSKVNNHIASASGDNTIRVFSQVRKKDIKLRFYVLYMW